MNSGRPAEPAGASTASRPAMWAITPAASTEAAAPAAPAAEPSARAVPAAPSPWPARWRTLRHGLHELGRGIATVWNTPKVRLVLVGGGSLLLGAVIVPGSAWTLPLIIFGAVLLLIASVGSRLDGRFALQWGAHGTQVEFRAEIKASPPQHGRGLRLAPAVETPDPPEVIEGEAHTVEIDVDELKALIAAAEAAEAAGGAVPKAS